MNKNKSYYKYLIGDNAKVGKRKDHEQASGNYGFGERNEIGEKPV